MDNVKEGDVAIIEYSAVVVDSGMGEVASQQGRMRLRAGDGGALGGIDVEVVGMSVGEKKSLEIPPARAFGTRDPELVMDMPRERFKQFPELKTGALVRLHSKSGKKIEVVTREITEKTVKVDANHPLAGMFLNFDMKVLAVESA